MARPEAVIKVVATFDPDMRRTLEEIRDRLPAATGRPAPAPRGSVLAEAKRQALSAVLAALDGWIEGCQENHEALGHGGERIGEECWRSFAPDDIRKMINDAAREVGVAEFVTSAIRREDLYL